MSNEIELKFEIDQSSIESISHFFDSLTILERTNYQLENIYYDTPDSYLKSHRISIRVRSKQIEQQAKQYEMTLKSAGLAVAGLHQRLEYNVDLTNEQIDLTLFPRLALPKDADITWLTKQLIAQFTTHFTRHVWLVSVNQSEIEIALDMGSIAVTKNKQIPIQEIELELKSGNQNDLIELALQVTRFKSHLFSQSKASRGYQLLKGSKINKIDNLDIDIENLKSTLAKLLQFWQTNEEYALIHNDLNFYQNTLFEVKTSLAKIIAALTNKESSNLLISSYQIWSQQCNHIEQVKMFAFSESNNKLKLLLMRVMLTNELNANNY